MFNDNCISLYVGIDNATDEEMKLLLFEMDLLASLGPHKHLVSLLRVCTVERE